MTGDPSLSSISSHVFSPVAVSIAVVGRREDGDDRRKLLVAIWKKKKEQPRSHTQRVSAIAENDMQSPARVRGCGGYANRKRRT